MKTSELIKILKQHGCYMVRHGGNHDTYFSPISGRRFQLWRHAKEVPTGTCETILKAAGIKR